MIGALARLALGALLAMAAPAAAQDLPAWDAVPMAEGQTRPDIVLTGRVDRSHHQRNLSLPFDVPEGVTRIGVRYAYSRPDGRTGINLGLYEGDRLRGWSGGNKTTVVIDESSATPSYTAGPIGGRRWFVDLGVSWIGEGTVSDYKVEIWFWRRGQIPAVSTFSPEPLEQGARWYRGDFHLHTGHSDGFCHSRRGRRVPCPLYRTLEAAHDARLDFVAITEHNNLGAYNDMRALQPYHDDLLIIPGREMTTSQGHANIFGTTEFVDYRLGATPLAAVPGMIADAKGAGALLSINHPDSASNHKCRGCGWAARDPIPDGVDAIEVMTSGGIRRQRDGDTPGRDILFWEKQLAAGRRVTAIGGSDAHDVDIGRLGVGYPTTLVHAENLSERAVLDAVRRGHVMIDMSDHPGLNVRLEAEGGGRKGIVGDGFAVPAGAMLDLRLEIAGAAGRDLIGYVDGVADAALSRRKLGDGRQAVALRWASDGKRHWLRFEVRGGKTLLLMTNPVYVNW